VLIVRATARLRQRLGPSTLREEQSTTLLGQWYATDLRWRPQVALLVNETTLLPVLMPLAPAATLPTRAAEEIATVLAAHGAPDTIIHTEREHMREWRIGPTANRSVVGIMNEFTTLAHHWRPETRPDLLTMSMRLARVPCSPLYKRHVSPDLELTALLEAVVGP